MLLQCWTTSRDMATPKVQQDAGTLLSSEAAVSIRASILGQVWLESVTECPCVTRRGSALRPLSGFLAVPQHSSLPIIPRERLPLPFIGQNQRPDGPLRDLQLRPGPTYRWVTSYRPTGLDLFLSTHITKLSVCKTWHCVTLPAAPNGPVCHLTWWLDNVF